MLLHNVTDVVDEDIILMSCFQLCKESEKTKRSVHASSRRSDRQQIASCEAITQDLAPSVHRTTSEGAKGEKTNPDASILFRFKYTNSFIASNIQF